VKVGFFVSSQLGLVLCNITIMKWILSLLILLFSITINYSCNDNEVSQAVKYKYLALGDSYTYGESVCETCSFPVQLIDTLYKYHDEDVSLLSIAQTGWTTTNLINQINTINPSNDYDLVTLLIGVNNQYQRIPFSIYEEEFPAILETAIFLARNDHNRVIVISIPDYSFTPLGQLYSNSNVISNEIAQYNEFSSSLCEQENIYFEDITDITVLGLVQPDLVAPDGLHLSKLTYSKIVERIFEKASSVLH